MTRIFFGLAGIAAIGAVLFTAPNLSSQTEQNRPRPDQRPGNRAGSENRGQRPQRGDTRPAVRRPAERTPRDAGPPERRPGERGGLDRAEFDPLFGAFDIDRDGEISAKELENAQAALLKLDTNSDGQIAGDEIPRPRFPEFGPPGGGGPGGGGPGGRGGPNREKTKLVEEFDVNKNDYLDLGERKAARVALTERRAADGGRGRRPGGRGSGGPGGNFGNAEESKPGPTVAMSDAEVFTDKGLYDAGVLRTLFFELEADDWEQELTDFYRTDVDVPARLIVDGKSYENVGLRFRGNSSFFTVANGQKRSLNVSIDFVDGKQNLHGFQTLNLLNAHTDPSFLRTVLFDQIARDYLPAPKANFVKVVINGESWGIYINEQQFNSDFLEEWFGESRGTRWKVPPDFSGGGALSFKGDNPDDYRRSYEIKTKDRPEAWEALIELCRTLEEIPADRIEEELDSQLNVDRALWFLALDNVFVDGDGYFSRGSDYYIYRDGRHGRFHLLPHDSNETFRLSSGGGPGGPPGGRRGRRPGSFGGPGSQAPGGGRPGGGGPGGRAPGGRGPDAGPDAGPQVGFDPLMNVDQARLPIVHRLLTVPALKARYLAHIRTIATDWLDWDRLGPVYEQYHDLIDAEVQADTRKLYSYDAFANAATEDGGGAGPGGRSTAFRKFVEERRKYLLSHPEIAAAAPTITSVNASLSDKAAGSVIVRAKLGAEVNPSAVFLHTSSKREAPFNRVVMQHRGEGLFEVTVAGVPAGATLRYYVEAQTNVDQPATSFHPQRAEAAPLTLDIPVTLAENSAVVINELLASNTRTKVDAQGEFDDWIELRNRSDANVDLSGMYLSDSITNLKKWMFPDGTKIAANGYLVVWADEDGKDSDGLHANFKLSKSGEGVWLVAPDARRNVVLDSVEFPPQRSDVAFGRLPLDADSFGPLVPTPGAANSDE